MQLKNILNDIAILISVTKPKVRVTRDVQKGSFPTSLHFHPLLSEYFVCLEHNASFLFLSISFSIIQPNKVSISQGFYLSPFPPNQRQHKALQLDQHSNKTSIEIEHSTSQIKLHETDFPNLSIFFSTIVHPPQIKNIKYNQVLYFLSVTIHLLHFRVSHIKLCFSSLKFWRLNLHVN